MRQWFHSRLILVGIVLIGIMATMVLLGVRVGTETNNTNVAVVMSYEDAVSLADSGNIPIEACLTHLRDMGVAAIVLSDDGQIFSDQDASIIKDAGLGLILSPTGEMPLTALNDWKTTLDATYSLYLSSGGTVKGLADSGLTIGLVEDHSQYGPLPIPEFDSSKATNAMTRVFYLYPEYAARYGAYGYNGAQEIENILYRAMIDRNVRVLWLTPFVSADTGAIISNLDEYAQMLSNLQSRIAEHSLTIGKSFGMILPYSPNQIELLISYFGVAAGGVLLLESIINCKRWIRYSLYALAVVATAAGWWLLPLFMQKIVALAAAVIFPCLATRWLVHRVKHHPVGHGFGVVLGEIFLCTAGSLVITLMGAAFVGGILSSSVYMLVIESFSGVKLSQALPLVFGLYITVRELMYRRGKPLRTQLSDGISRLRRSGKLLMILSAIMILMGVVFFVLGTGDSGALRGVTSILRFRNWLENCLPVRPRLKEFLMAWPALAVGVYLAGRERQGWAAPFLFMASLGFASVINTFSHIRASVLISLERTMIGVLCGLLLGAIAILVLKLIRQSMKSWGSKP